MDEEYVEWIQSMGTRFKRMQVIAAAKVNQEMLRFYLSLGKDMVGMRVESIWNSKFYDSLSRDLASAMPEQKNFSPRNLRFMTQFYQMYSKILPQLVEKQIVMKLVHKLWMKYVSFLGTYWLDIDLYERQGKAITNFNKQLPIAQGDLFNELTKDPYNFDFLIMTEGYNEKELKDALTDNIVKFLLELGKGFAFGGLEYRLKVGKTEQKKSAIGLIICKEKDEAMTQYAVESAGEPIGISEYELLKV